MNRDSVLNERGLERLAHIPRLGLDVWWSSEHKIEIHLLDLGSCSLIRGAKTYYVKGLSEEGEIYARDIEPMLDWLELHFPVVRVYFNYFRDISRSLALSRIRDKNFRETGLSTVYSNEL